MNFTRNILLLLLILLSLSSCMINNSVRTLQIEIMRPGIFDIPKNLTIAVINRDQLRSDACTFYYSNGYLTRQDTITSFYDLYEKLNEMPAKQQSLYEMVKDTTIKYHNLSETCTNTLVNYLKEEGNFQKVTNYRDSLNYLLKIPGSIATREELFEKTKSDVCIFLDIIPFKTTFNIYFSTPFKTQANLLWTIAFKTDSIAYGYQQTDTLFFDRVQVRQFSGPRDKILKHLLTISCEYLGRSFGTKVIPSWIPVQRLYYKSKNRNMLEAERFAIKQDWLKAAEIWNKETKNKNWKIAAKACFNMALACEMEGNPDVAIGWLAKSNLGLKRTNEDHKFNCQQYVNVLATRKLEIDRLNKQMQNPEINSIN